METLKKYWTLVFGVFLAILGAFFYERNRANKAEAKVASSENDKDRAVLETKREEIAKDLAAVDTDTEKKKQDATDDEVLDFIKKL